MRPARLGSAIRRHAPDDRSRDLGITAAPQRALLEWIAAFSTVANDARHLGPEDIARAPKSCPDDAKDADRTNTDLAEQLLRRS